MLHATCYMLAPEKDSLSVYTEAGCRLRPDRRVEIIFLEVISPWWSRSQNHRDIPFQTFPETQSGESGISPHHHAETVLGWRASFPFQIKKSERFRVENSKIGKRDGAAKETTKEPSPNLNVGNNLPVGKFSMQGFRGRNALHLGFLDVQGVSIFRTKQEIFT